MRTSTSSGRGGRVRVWSAVFLVLSSACAIHVCTAQASGSAESQYTTFESRPAQQMDPADAAVLRKKHHEVVTEAAFWGYDLNSGQWTANQVVCPDIPDAVVLHYRRAGAKGESLFTAVVQRETGKVLIVPVLYHGSTPFESAFNAKRTMSVFNQAVPAELAQRDAAPDGHWLQLAITYAVIAGAEPRVPKHPEQQPGLMQAPDPTLKVAEAEHTREIVFSDRQAPRKYTVWTVDLNQQGRVTEAGIRVISDFESAQTAASEPAPGSEPDTTRKPKKVKEQEEPKVRVVQEPPDPNAKPAPQQ